MSFERGQFRPFRATNKIHLGKYETDILQNDQFDYDGYTIRYGGVEYSVPQLRGLFGDWFVPVEDQTTTYRSRPAGVKVSHATPEARDRGDSFTMDEASEEEAVIGTMDEQKQIREAASKGKAGAERLAQLRSQRDQRKANIRTGRAGGTGEVVTDTNPAAPPPENAADVDDALESALMDAAQDQMQYEQARPVHGTNVGTEDLSGADNAALARANALNQQRIAQRAAELEQQDPRRSRDQMGGARQDSADDQGKRVGTGGKYGLVMEEAGGVPVSRKYNFSGGAVVGAEGVAGMQQEGTNVLKVASKSPVQVGSAVASTPNREAGAIVVPDTSETHEAQAVGSVSTTQVSAEGNVGIDEVMEGGYTGDVDATRSGEGLSEILPDAAVAGATRKTPPPSEMSESDEITEILGNWNKKRNWQKRVQEAVDYYGDWPEAITAICDFESEKVAAQIRSRLSKAEVAAST